MAFNPRVADGTLVKLMIGTVYYTVPGVTNPKFGGGGKKEIEYTAIDDTAAKYRGGKPDFGNFTFGLRYDPPESTHAALWSSYITPNSTDSFQLTMTDDGAATILANGYVQNMELGWQNDQMNSADVSVKLSGVPIVTP